MRFISHRGNLDGPMMFAALENHPASIGFAIHEGFDVEVDIWEKGGKLWFGHDEPMYEIEDNQWLVQRRDHLLCHAKNTKAATILQELGMEWFGNNFDAFVSTSSGRVILHPQAKYIPGCIVMMPENRKARDLALMDDAAGFCSDDIMFYKEYYDV